LGTVWVAPGDGATVRELIDVAPSNVIDTAEFHMLKPLLNRRTSLELTKERIREYDIERIREALRRVRIEKLEE